MNPAAVPQFAGAPSGIRLLPDPGAGRPVDRSEPDLLRYLSASRLKCWQSCRRQFYYRYVERVVAPTAPALFIGRQIHEVLRLWNWAKWRRDPLTPEQLRAALDERWEIEGSKEFIPWKTPDDETLARDQAWSTLQVVRRSLHAARMQRSEAKRELGGFRGLEAFLASCLRPRCSFRTRRLPHHQPRRPQARVP